jgi:hypothetical protein
VPQKKSTVVPTIVPKGQSPSQERFKKVVPTALTLEDIALFKQLPVLTLNLEQIGRVLQKPIEKIYELSHARASRPLPVFKSGKSLCSTWSKIQQWIEDGFAKR